jgi:6-phosphogluconolactonase
VIHTKPGAGPRHLAFHPNGRFLYLITETMHTIGAYAIDPRVWDIEGVAIRRRIAGRFQGTACRRRSARDAGRPVSLWQRAPDQHPRGYRIDSETGTLSPIGHFATEKTPRGFAIEPRGRFLLSVGLDSNAMTVHRIDPQSGALRNLKQYPMGQQPNWIEIVDLR